MFCSWIYTSTCPQFISIPPIITRQRPTSEATLLDPMLSSATTFLSKVVEMERFARKQLPCQGGSVYTYYIRPQVCIACLRLPHRERSPTYENHEFRTVTPVETLKLNTLVDYIAASEVCMS